MSTVPHYDDGDQPVPEQKSRVKLIRNAKGDPQWELSVVEGADPVEIGRIAGIAVAQYRELERDLA